MKSLFFLVAALVLAVAGAFYLDDVLFSASGPGHVLIGHGSTQWELSLRAAIVILLLGFVMFYLIMRLSLKAIRLPSILRHRKQDSLQERSTEGLVSGLIDSAEGNWEKAEKSLIRHAANSGAPLMHYLTAARAAQSRGAFSKRDEYLQLAYESTPGSELTVGLTEVELQLSDKQFDKALESLTALKSIAPGHASVLRLQHQTYRNMQDWKAIHKLMPDLQKNKVLMEAEIKLLQTETYSELLKECAESRDIEGLKLLWAEIPKNIRTVSGMNAIYYAGMIDAGAGAEIESSLRDDLAAGWNETLVVLYGCVESKNPGKQIKLAEAWLADHSDDAILLRMLGKLCLRAEDGAKAREYLNKSLEMEPSVDGFLFLGDLLAREDLKDQSLECYRKGLIFASDEVVKHIEQMQVDVGTVA